MKNRNRISKYGIYIVLITGFAVCFAMLFPQVRQMIVEFGERRMLHMKTTHYEEWHRALLSYAMGGIFLFSILGYCLLTVSGKTFVSKVKDEIRDCLSEIEWRSFIKPVLLMSGIYLLGILSIIRANFLYLDDIRRSAAGFRRWHDWSRYVSEFSSIFIHGDTHLTDISPLPQLIAVFILAVSSVLFVYVLNNRKITIISLLASIPIGLSPYMLECLSFKFDAPYMALSVLASIVPFLFIARKKAFVFCSIISLLVMCMTYQASSGIYLLVTLVLCFKDWNGKRKTNREVFLFLGRAVLSFCMAMIIFKLFLMKQMDMGYTSNTMFPLSQMFSGILTNFKTYVNLINNDFGFIWKTIIGIIFCFFIAKSVYTSAKNKMISFFIATILLFLIFPLSFGVYLALENPLWVPRAMYGAGILLGIISIYVVSEFNNVAKIAVLALSWSFFIFAFSYGNALADQMRYANFRAGILLHDLSALYPDKDENEMMIELKNTIGVTPLVKNIGKRNPVIYRLVPQVMREVTMREGLSPCVYLLEHFNYAPYTIANIYGLESFGTLDLPVVLKTYYHTIRSDGKRVLVELNEGMK